ncbi:hypothetical protein GY45DRAFT_1308542 [Cubamyces sp. BRFM 1775]|nr:hypothetical protein GY45DRAFT_1308542 [Cubamyces sp. BRFM 1775]
MDSPLILETLPGDVIVLIAQTVHSANNRDLSTLACVSHRLRALCFSLLFAHCRITSEVLLSSEEPPESIREIVRRMTLDGSFKPLETEHLAQSLGTLFKFFPNLRHFQIRNVFSGIPWTVWDVCLEKVTSIDINYNSRWRTRNNPILHTPLYTQRNLLKHLSLGAHAWRALHSMLGKVDQIAEYMVESHHLTQLVCGMNETAESLALPMETAPLIRMSQMSWPRIQYLSLKGRYPPEMQATTLPALLSRMPTLRSLRVQAAQRVTFSRPHIWDSSMAPSSSALSELESLTIAYPNPDDDIFSVKTPRLIHLSLRDEPRYYFPLRTYDYVSYSIVSPILSASECLRILQRMETPSLTSLELVYQADTTEDVLLHHIASAYPSLARLELHRYREPDDALVPYATVAQILSSITSLQTVRFNFDSPETPPVHCRDYARKQSWSALSHSRALDILSIMRRCPRLEHIAVLDPRLQCCTWVEYHVRYPGGVAVHADVLDLYQVDCDKLPYR